MKILLTGANGFIGSLLAEKLSDLDYSIRCLVRSSSNLQWISDLDVELYYGNLFDKVSIKNALKDVEYVFHLAGTTKGLNRQDYFRGNVDTTVNLIDTILEENVKLKRFVFTSSLAAYGPSKSLNPIDETQYPRPLTWYGESKLAAQKYIEKNNRKIPTTIIIPPAVYGPRDTDVLEFFKTVKMGVIPQLRGSDKYASMVHASDLVDGLMEVLNHQNTRGEAYFIANPKPYAWSEIARVTLDLMGKRAINITVPKPVMSGIAFIAETYSRFSKKPNIISRQKLIELEQDFWICSAQKAKNDFGFETKIDIEEGIKDTLAWYVENNWL